MNNDKIITYTLFGHHQLSQKLFTVPIESSSSRDHFSLFFYNSEVRPGGSVWFTHNSVKYCCYNMCRLLRFIQNPSESISYTYRNIKWKRKKVCCGVISNKSVRIDTNLYGFAFFE
ncbi:unnamed protein product [Lepeophtheirus salmonis]|uniref:(salmon louse) hypothetical protein n=1 Tax=Lepeophtheirus salmonis TaxID=72036 RepID=A0A7R8CPX0_LEPSM|nr:unnamed protein product [Lepeophtheirus salmonis]CAF2855040.1 unnamed protein product [Lepeophtheirus salmonis]